jgi:hypothetical protein
MDEGGTYADKAYKNIDELVIDIAALARMFPESMRRSVGKGMTVRARLVQSTSAKSLEYLANYARFISRNLNIKVPYGTTKNEAFHEPFKASFRNLRQTSAKYVKTHARIVTVATLIAEDLHQSTFTKAMRKHSLMHEFCARLETNPLVFKPTIGTSPQSTPAGMKRPAASATAGGVGSVAKRQRSRS